MRIALRIPFGAAGWQIACRWSQSRPRLNSQRTTGEIAHTFCQLDSMGAEPRRADCHQCEHQVSRSRATEVPSKKRAADPASRAMGHSLASTERPTAPYQTRQSPVCGICLYSQAGRNLCSSGQRAASRCGTRQVRVFASTTVSQPFEDPLPFHPIRPGPMAEPQGLPIRLGLAESLGRFTATAEGIGLRERI